MPGRRFLLGEYDSGGAAAELGDSRQVTLRFLTVNPFKARLFRDSRCLSDLFDRSGIAAITAPKQMRRPVLSSKRASRRVGGK